jgi:hypothetical protein
MKEATGELNMTVITVVAIAAVAAFFYAFIWPAIKNNINHNTLCAAAYSCDAEHKNCKALGSNGQEVNGLDCSGTNTTSSSGATGTGGTGTGGTGTGGTIQ